MYIIGAVKTCISIAVLIASGVWAETANPCDRACMTGLVDRYLAAMVKHDPGQRDLKIRNGKIHEIEAMGVSSGVEGGIHPARSFSSART